LATKKKEIAGGFGGRVGGPAAMRRESKITDYEEKLGRGFEKVRHDICDPKGKKKKALQMHGTEKKGTVLCTAAEKVVAPVDW